MACCWLVFRCSAWAGVAGLLNKRHRTIWGEARDERGSIDEFLFVEGFDLGLAETEVCERRRRFIEEAAAELNTPLVVVRTNLLETLWGKRVNWDLWGHGAALASVALALEGRYRQVLIPASNMYLHLVPWGSHPLTDALFSSWSVRVRDDGAAHDRADKVRAIATSAERLMDCSRGGSARTSTTRSGGPT